MELAGVLASFFYWSPSLKQSAWLAGSVFLLMVPFLGGGYYVQDNLRRMLINVEKDGAFYYCICLAPFLFLLSIIVTLLKTGSWRIPLQHFMAVPICILRCGLFLCLFSGSQWLLYWDINIS